MLNGGFLIVQSTKNAPPPHDQLWALLQVLQAHGDQLLQTCNHS